jgi:hypothetical protein
MSSSPIATSSSGVDSAMRSMSAAAHDLAKASARDGKSARVDQAESKGGDAKSKAKPEDRPPAHVDEKLVELMRAKHAAKANLKAIKMEERMVGKLVDKHA